MRLHTHTHTHHSETAPAAWQYSCEVAALQGEGPKLQQPKDRADKQQLQSAPGLDGTCTP